MSNNDLKGTIFDKAMNCTMKRKEKKTNVH